MYYPLEIVFGSFNISHFSHLCFCHALECFCNSSSPYVLILYSLLLIRLFLLLFLLAMGFNIPNFLHCVFYDVEFWILLLL